MCVTTSSVWNLTPCLSCVVHVIFSRNMVQCGTILSWCASILRLYRHLQSLPPFHDGLESSHQQTQTLKSEPPGKDQDGGAEINSNKKVNICNRLQWQFQFLTKRKFRKICFQEP